MGTIWVKEFTGGLDTRRMPEATSGGVLVVANNGHVTRGGEFESRAAFVPTYTLPAGTVALFRTTASITVFGSIAAPIMPSGVAYQRLQHSDGVTALVRVPSADLYQGKIYAVGEFADGAIFHFYDGVRVTDWFDGRARATFAVTGGSVMPAVAASASFEITGGTFLAGVNKIADITIDGVSIITAAVDHTGNNSTTAAAIASAINGFTSTPDYTATSVGQTVNIHAVATSTAINGKAIVPTPAGDVTVGNIGNMAGGAVAVTSALADLKINGVSIISAPVLWTTTNEATAAAIAAAINGYTSTPDYTASASGNSVSVAAAVAGVEPNGFAGAFTANDGLVLDPSSFTMANGAASTTTYQPGTFVKTIGSKEYSVSGPNMHFSGIKAPTKWTTDTVGAGFIDMSSESSGSEQLTALARYQNLVAVFAERVVQLWYTDPDPSLNRQSQILENTGTASPLSVTAFGDTDLFYLDESGLRSLRARTGTTSAATTDIGVPVDSLVTDKLLTLTENERAAVVGLIEPKSGRFWLIMGDLIFVFSFFAGAKVSAWSTYVPSVVVSGADVPFEIEYATVFKRNVYVRAGNQIYVYGGLTTTPTYDETIAEAWLPYLDANDPTRTKAFTGIDAAIRGEWVVAAAMDPNRDTAEDEIATIDETTYGLDGKIPLAHEATHISLRFRSTGEGPHRLGACVIHYVGDDDED